MSMANRAFGAESRKQDGPRALPATGANGGRGVPDDWFVDPVRRGVPGTGTPGLGTPGVTAPDIDEPTTVSPRPSITLLPTIRSTPERTTFTGTGDDENLAWQTDSLCAQTDPEAFFPEKGGSTRDAKKICGSCEVRSQCLEYALQNDERFGIWGGLSERERRKLRKRA